MPNILSKIINLIMIMILYIVLIMNMNLLIDYYIYNQVNVVANAFQKEARLKGYIDQNAYDNLLKELSKTNRIYDIGMIHRDIKYYPVDNEKGYSVEYFKHNEKEILNNIYINKQNYLMHIGDDFKIVITEKGESDSRVIWNFLSGTKSNNSYIFATFGGVVENEIE